MITLRDDQTRAVTDLRRADAKALGLTRYFTGKPCPSGHIAERHTINGRCVECVRVYRRAHGAENLAAQNVRRAIGRELRPPKDPDRRKKYMAAYGARPAVLKKRRDTARARLKADPRYALNQRTRCQLANLMKGRGLSKARRAWSSLLGYTVDDLKRHLERLFLPGMSWENMSEWHIDHRIPLKHFRYTSKTEAEFLAAWALPNLQPLWILDNLSKGGKRIHLL